MTLAVAMRDHGCNLVELAGWHGLSYKGRPTDKFTGTMGHHDASARTRDELAVCLSYQRGINRPGGYLPGPIYGTGVGKRTVYLMADGYTNHAGRGLLSVRRATQNDVAPTGLASGGGFWNGNPYYYGIVLLNNGTTEDVPDTQFDQWVRAIAAVHDYHGWTGRQHVEHREFTSRKIDPSRLPVDGRGVRAAVGLHLLNPNPEPDMMMDTATSPPPGVGGRIPTFTTTPQGVVVALNGAEWYGDLRGVGLAAPIVAIVSTPPGDGYWLVGADGGVFAFGGAGYPGNVRGEPIIYADLILEPPNAAGRRDWRLVLYKADAGDGIATFKLEGSTGYYVDPPDEPDTPDIATITDAANRIDAETRRIRGAL